MATALPSFAIGVGLSYLAIVIMDHLGKPGGTAAELAVSELALWAPLIGGVVLVSTRRGSRSLVRDFDLAWRPVDIGFGFAGSLAARTLSSVVILPVVILFPKLSSPDVTLFRPLTTGAIGWLVLVVVTCVGAPIVEELFFRGLIQTRLVGRFGPVVGIGATSILFGAAHLIDWSGLAATSVYALSIVGAGVALGTIRHLTGRLGTSMMTHCWFNTQAMIALAATNAHSFKI